MKIRKKLYKKFKIGGIRMGKLKVMVVVGTRPEIIRLSEVIKAIDKYFELILVHTRSKL